MKRILILIAVLAMALTITACGSGGDESAPSGQEETGQSQAADIKNDGKVLVAYFSRVGNTQLPDGVDASTSASINVAGGDLSGNTQMVADMIQKQTDGDLFLIKAKQPYPADYDACVDQAKEEQDDDVRPALASRVENMEDYDVVFLGFPNWWGTMPMPVFTFLEEYDFSGKTVIPFSTHEGSGLGSSEEDIKKMCPDVKLAQGFDVRGSSAADAQKEVKDWLSEIGIEQ